MFPSHDRAGAGIWEYGVNSNGRLQYGYLNSEGGSKTSTVTFNNNGTVGIGEGNPQSTLTILGNSGDGHIEIGNDTGAGYIQVIDRDAATQPSKELQLAASKFEFLPSASQAPYFEVTQSMVSGSINTTASFAHLLLKDLPAISDDTVLTINADGVVGTKEGEAGSSGTSGTSGSSGTSGADGTSGSIN